MEVGKVPMEILQNLIIKPLQYNRTEVLLRPDVGEDCSALQVKEDEVLVLTSDPITGASENIGKLAVHICCNDLASSGAEPIGIMITILMPEGTSKEILQKLMQEISQATQEVNIDILGGHTEVTTAVNKVIVSATAIGKVKKENLVASKNAQIGDDLILTKGAGLEGTAIIATEKEEELSSVFSKERIAKAKSFINQISVIPEGLKAAEFGVHAMHDVTEGGVLGAVWELAEASDVGVRIYKEQIPLYEETAAVCEYYNIDPLKLISSGSMLIVAPKGENLVSELKKIGVQAAVIGQVTKEDKILVTKKENLKIEEPQSDELYKVIK